MCDRMIRPAVPVTPSEPAADSPSRCPICGGPNACTMACGAAARACWCMAVADIPVELRAEANRRGGDERCVCEACVDHFRRTGRLRRHVA
ncbi:MAG: cysteine-rich CWC family protein [Planctomycetota bacterium]